MQVTNLKFVLIFDIEFFENGKEIFTIGRMFFSIPLILITLQHFKFT